MSNKDINVSMLCDFYEFTMSNGYLKSGHKEQIAYFEMFFRKVPDNGGFAISCGVHQIIEYIKNLEFNAEDIEYLRGQKLFDEEFLDYLYNFKFTCDVWAIPEGTPVFPGEPLIIVRGPIIQAQLLETVVLICMNHQSLIATKANRIVRVAEGRPIMEFGARRAQGFHGAIHGTRSAYIGGCAGTSCTIAAKMYDIPALGTMAHSWVQMFDSEYEAFRAYAEIYLEQTNLLIDTYNVLKSGLPNAIRVFDEVLKPRGIRPAGIRIDSGDIAYLTKKCRKTLDNAGYSDCKIVVSNSLDEYIIRELLTENAPIDSFGVGERLITSRSEPVFGGVYKLVALEDKSGNIIPKIKISENTEKITTPHFKQVYRLFNKTDNMAIADVVTLHNEAIDESKPYELFDPDFIWKRKTVDNFTVRPLLNQIYKNGELKYKVPHVKDTKAYCLSEVNKIWDEVKRFENPHNYYVDLSQDLWDIKHNMLMTQNNM